MHAASPQSAQVPARRTDDLLAALADRLGARFAASTFFGEPIQREDVTVIPVATLRFGFGGGAGSDPAKAQNGEGGGAACASTPVGYIEIKRGRSRFVPVVHPARMVTLVGLIALAAMWI